MIKYFKNTIDSILKNEIIENIKIERTKLLSDIIFDKEFLNKLLKGFIDNFHKSNCNYLDLYTKIQDMVYRIHLVVNELLIPKYNLHDKKDILPIMNDLLDDIDSDFYSAVDYNDLDKEIIEEFDTLLPKFKI